MAARIAFLSMLSYVQSVEGYLKRVWTLILSALAKVQVPDASSAVEELRALDAQGKSARTGNRQLSADARRALRAAEIKATAILAAIRSRLLDLGEKKTAESLPVRSVRRVGDRKAYVDKVLAAAKPYADVPGVDLADLSARIQAFQKVLDEEATAKKDPAVVGADLKRQVDDLMTRCASMVVIAREVARLAGDPSLGDGAPTQPGPTFRRKKKGAPKKPVEAKPDEAKKPDPPKG